ncbi:MAG: shikimate dehydrogenase [Butyrivibrio sp.]|nr:shikimate dehydrogenase [Acetatifactor muris]MCM1559458.1 shikimate dehydrogenase [Butyrivibrio sp.]
MSIDGYTRTCGLIGSPVEHTMSPAIHNTLAEAMGENLVYVPFHVQPEQVKEAVEGAYALNLLGCNVTVPYKSRVIPYLKEMDPLGEKIGAVNTLVRVEGGFRGYNTDMPGLLRAMEADGVKTLGERVLILGAGGVARAVAVMLSERAEKILLLNRTLEKAREIAEEVNSQTGRKVAEAMPVDDWRQLPAGGRYLAVQTTSVGMFPEAERAVIEEADFYKRIHTGYDLIFNPAETRFMQLTEAAGGRAYNGLRMLLYQGVIAYELWTGRKVAGEQEKLAYRAMQQAMHMGEEA